MLIALFPAALAGVNPVKVPTQDLVADDGDSRSFEGGVQFAVVGDCRPAIPGETAPTGRVATPDAEARIVKDISAHVQDGTVDFAVLLGDLVRSSSTAEWKRFSEAWAPLISGSELPTTGVLRTRVVAVAGNHDRIGDDRMVGFGAAFPGVGADIGFGRVATWYAFDVVQKGNRWRMLVLDSSRESLGSRWDEQMAWIPKALDGDYDGLLVFMHHPRWTLASDKESDEAKAPSELIEQVELSTDIGKMKVVFSGHSHTNEVYLPGGKLGEMFVVAGGGGSPADSLARWGVRENKDLKIEAIYDLALLKEFDRHADAKLASQALRDKAKATGSFEGYIAEIDAHVFPIQGWWNVALDGADMHLTFRVIGADGTLKDLYAIDYDDRDGWKIGR